MTLRNLEFLLDPASVALIGSGDESDPHYAALARNLTRSGFHGDVFLVGHQSGTVDEHPVYCRLADLPAVPALAILATPPAILPPLIAELGQLGTKAAAVITPEPDQDVPAWRQALLDAAKPYLLRLLGPDCRTLIVPARGLNAGLGHVQPLAGRIAFIAQSGAVAGAVLDWAYAHNVGFSHLLNLGDMVDVDFGDLLDYLTRATTTKAILLCIEHIEHARKFMSAGRAAARTKPVLVLKAGPTDDAVYDAAFRRAGMLRVYGLRDLFAAVETLALTEPVYGDRLAVVTNGSGTGLMAVDALRREGGTLAELAPDTRRELDRRLPARGAHANPVDILDDAPAGRYAAALAPLLADRNVDAVLVLNSPTALASGTEAAQAVSAAVVQAGEHGRRPAVFTCWLGAGAAHAVTPLLAEHGIGVFDSPEQAVRAFMNRMRYRRNRELLMQTPPAIPADFNPDRDAVCAIIAAVLRDQRSWLREVEAHRLLAAYGVPVIPTQAAATPDECAAIAADFGGPVAVKIDAARLRRRAQVGGVALGLETPAVVRDNAVRLWERIGDCHPEVEPLGFTVQPMVDRSAACELSLGLLENPRFGPVLWFGQGGGAAELIDDRAYALPPLNLPLAQELMARTRLYPLLKGGAHFPPADLPAIALTLVKLSQLVVDHAEIVGFELDPVLADAAGVWVLGARIQVAASTQPATQRLAIRPYPQELEESFTLPDGRQFKLRPIRPEDEPAMHAGFALLTPEEIRLRFMYFMGTLTHEAAARYTQIDYDREMALVLVQEEAGATQLYGVVRMVAGPDRERAEFAIIISQRVTGLGLGAFMLRRLINYARRQGIREIFGEVLRENVPMLALCRALGFTVRMHPEDYGVMEVVLALV